jgi:hypothetical protein
LALPSGVSVKLDCRPPMVGVSRPRLPWGVRCCCAAARLPPIGDPSALSNAEGLEAMKPAVVVTPLGDGGMACTPSSLTHQIKVDNADEVDQR